MNKTKIALFMTPLLNQGGGTEKYFINLANNLAKKNCLCDVITLDDNFNHKLFLLYHVRHLNFSFLLKKVKIVGREKEKQVKKDLGQSRWLPTTISNLKKILNTYDVIYAKNELIELLPLKFIGLKNLPPVIVGIHTPIEYPQNNSILSLIHNFLYKGFFYRWLTKDVKLFHVSNQFTLDLVKKIYRKPTTLIYYPFSLVENAKNLPKIQFNKQKFNLIFIGRLSNQKGIDELNRLAIRLSKNKKWERKICLNIFGTGDERSLFVIKKLEKKYSFVRYFGHIENKFISNILQQHKILISTSLWEVLPFNILEAQALGLPVIAFDIPGPKDIIINNTTGILVKNENEFYNKLIQYLNGKISFDKKIIINNVSKKFNPDLIYNNLYKMIISIK